MARKKTSLYCHMNGQSVGVLEKVNGTLNFRYSDSWLGSKSKRPISVSLPLTDLPYKGDIVEAYFDNLLPDNTGVRKAIAERVKAKSAKPYDLLAAIGRDCVGALTLTDSDIPPPLEAPAVTHLTGSELQEHIKRTRTGHTFGMQNGDFRFSLAGAQDKTALTFHEGRLGIPIGATPTTHILKPHIISNNPDVDFSSSISNEWFCLELLKQLSALSSSPLPVANAEILTFGDMKVLSVERFDRLRRDGLIYRLPQEDFCQALGMYSANKYESEGGPTSVQIADLLSTSVEPYVNKVNFIRCQFIFFLLAAIDGHAKNFSIFIRPGGKIELTPIYDVMSAYPYLGQGELQPKKIKMAMAVRSKNAHYKWSEIQPRHWAPHARKHGLHSEDILPVLREVLDKFGDAFAAAKSVASQKYPFTLTVANAIEAQAMQLVDKYTRLGF